MANSFKCGDMIRHLRLKAEELGTWMGIAVRLEN